MRNQNNRRKNGQYDNNSICSCCSKPMTDEFFGIENANPLFLEFIKKYQKNIFLLALCENCGDKLHKAQEYFLQGIEYRKNEYRFHAIEFISKKELKMYYLEQIVKCGYSLPFECSDKVRGKIESLVFGMYSLPDSYLTKIKDSIEEMEHFINVMSESDVIYICK